MAAVKMNSLVVLAMLTAALAVSATTASDDAGLVRYPGRRARRNRHRRRTPAPIPGRPSPTPVPTPPGRVPSPPPSPAGFLLPCDRPDVPPVLSVTAGQNATGGGRDCLPRPAPSSPPQPRFRRPPLCVCPKPPAPGGGGGGGGGSYVEQDCVAPLAPLMACGPFITAAEDNTPTPPSECCLALGAFLNGSRAATAAGIGDGGLRCLCPFIVGDVNKVMPRPVDPVRLMYLPIACGVVLPPETLFMCFTGHPSPHAVSKFSQLWEKEKGVHG